MGMGFLTAKNAKKDPKRDCLREVHVKSGTLNCSGLGSQRRIKGSRTSARSAHISPSNAPRLMNHLTATSNAQWGGKMVFNHGIKRILGTWTQRHGGGKRIKWLGRKLANPGLVTLPRRPKRGRRYRSAPALQGVPRPSYDPPGGPSIWECGDTSPLWNLTTCRRVQKRGPARALQNFLASVPLCLRGFQRFRSCPQVPRRKSPTTDPAPSKPSALISLPQQETIMTRPRPAFRAREGKTNYRNRFTPTFHF